MICLLNLISVYTNYTSSTLLTLSMRYLYVILCLWRQTSKHIREL